MSQIFWSQRIKLASWGDQWGEWVVGEEALGRGAAWCYSWLDGEISSPWFSWHHRTEIIKFSVHPVLAFTFYQFSSFQSLSHVLVFATPWTAAHQASLSITNTQSLLKPTSIESVMPSNHLILCRPLLLLPSTFPPSGSFPMSQFFASGGQSIGASASILPMTIQGWSPLGWTGWISLQSKGLSRVFSNTTVQKHQFISAQLSFGSNSHIHTWPLENVLACLVLTIQWGTCCCPHFTVEATECRWKPKRSWLSASLLQFKSFLFLLKIITWSEVAQSCPTVCDPVDCGPPGFPVHGILQARIPEWVTISFCRRSNTIVQTIQCGRCFAQNELIVLGERGGVWNFN